MKHRMSKLAFDKVALRAVATRAKDGLTELLAWLPQDSADRPSLLAALATCRAILKDHENG